DARGASKHRTPAARRRESCGAPRERYRRSSPFFSFAARPLHVASQVVERRFPEWTVEAQEGDGGLQGACFEVAAMVPTVALAPHQSRPFDDTKMLGNGGERHRKRLGQLAD